MHQNADGEADFELKEDSHHGSHVQAMQQAPKLMPQHFDPSQSSMPDALLSSKWPTRLLSLLHPFNVEVGLDDALEAFLGLNLPFLDFRVGVQGADESFSFALTKEDEDFHSDRANPSKVIRMLRLSQHKRVLLDRL
jgi:hypothetical protein